MIINNYLLFLLPLLLFPGCRSDIVYQSSKKISPEGWSYGDKLVFEFEIEDSMKRYDLFLDVFHLDEYSFENLYLRVNTKFPNDSIVRDLLPVEMANKFGGWLGQCSYGKCILKVVLQQNVRFPITGSYQLIFEQYTRQDSLQGISQIDFTLTEES